MDLQPERARRDVVNDDDDKVIDENVNVASLVVLPGDRVLSFPSPWTSRTCRESLFPFPSDRATS